MPPEISRFLLPLYISTASRSSSDTISPFSSVARPKVSRKAFLSDSASSKKFPERLFSPSRRPPESFPTLPPEISRFLLPLDSLRPRGLRQTPYLHFHQSPARKSPERLFSPSQHPPRSFLTTPPEISRFPFGTKVIKILDLSPYLPPTRPFAVSPTLPYSPKPVLHQPRHQTESAPLVHQSPCTFILISPCLTTTLISPVHHFLQSPSSLSRQAHPHCYPSYSPKPVLHQPRHQTESTPLVHQSPSTFYPHFTLSYNNTHQSSSSLPTITKFAFPTVHPALFSFSLAI